MQQQQQHDKPQKCCMSQALPQPHAGGHQQLWEWTQSWTDDGYGQQEGLKRDRERSLLRQRLLEL